MAVTPKHPQALVLTAPDTVAAYAPPAGATALVSTLGTDDTGAVFVIAVIAGVPTKIILTPAAGQADTINPYALTTPGVNPNAAPAGTISFTVIDGSGAARVGALVWILFTFPVGEALTITPSVGAVVGGDYTGLNESGAALVQTGAGGVFTAALAFPALGVRTVTATRWAVLPYGNQSDLQQNNAFVFGGP